MTNFSTSCCGLFFLFAAALSAQPGTLDGAFGLAGKTTTAFGSGDDYGQAVAVQADGKILVAGYADLAGKDAFAIARYLPDGTPDSSFSNDGKQTTSFGTGDHRAYAIALQPDGKIVVGGYATISSEFDFAIARYKTDGSLDPTFSGDGKTTTNLGGFFDKAYALVIQPDGNIVLAGTLGENTNSDFGLVRYHANGTLDPTFGTSGIATLSIGSSYDEARALALQPDGKLVAAGFTNAGPVYNYALARFTADGKPDLSFNGTGQQSTPIGLGDYGQAVAVQPDGAIVLLGYSATTSTDYDFALVRYLANGTPDPAFGIAGVVVSSLSTSFDAGYALAVQPDGKILAGGYAAGNGHPDFALARYLANGSPDPGFGTMGVVKTDFAGGTDQISALMIGMDGKILAAGRSNNGTDFDFALARYRSGLTVGVPEPESSISTLSLAPNPVTDRARLRYSLDRESRTSLWLYDFSGRLVQAFFTNEKRNPGPQQEPLVFSSKIPAGQYMLVLKNNLGESRQLRVVKN